MEFKELKSFVCVVDNESITTASKKLFMTQPAISTHIKHLENELNEKILKKGNKKVIPTKKGMELYEYAKKILNIEKDFNEKLKNSNKLSLKIGVSSIPSLYCLPEILGSYKKSHKNTVFKIYQSDSVKIMEALDKDIIDVGLIGMDIKDKKIICEAFYKDAMILVTPNTKEYKNMLKLKGATLINELIKKPFIMREDGSGSKRNILKFLEKFGIDTENLNILGEINSQDTILKLIASGMGISIISKKVINDRNKKLLYYEFPNIKNERNLNIIYKNDKLKKHIKDFITFTKSFYK